MVPQLIPNLTAKTIEQLNEGTIILRKVLPLIDGKKHIKAISRLSEIHIDLVKQCVQNLLMFGVVQVFDLF